MTVSGRRWVVPVVVVVVAAIFGAVGVIVFVGPRPGRAAGASVRLEAAGRPGSDPFTTSVTIGKTVSFPGTIHAITTHQVAHLASDSNTGGVRAQGSAPGLYGGTGNNAVCDPQQLAGFLTHNPSKAAAWAGVLGIRPSEIAGYIATLTPVVLTTDTRVTNHGYRDGAATTLQSVLQAGTAVLVDARGVPRVKCGCGNPLTPPTSTPIGSTTGTAWPAYQRSTVTTITPAPRPVKTLTLTNLDTGGTYQQPTGTSTGTTHQQPTGTPPVWVALLGSGDSAATAQRSDDGGHTWTPVRLPAGVSPVSVAFGGGKWVGVAAVYNGTAGDVGAEPSPNSSAVLASADGRAWSRVATVPASLTSVAYGNGRWIAVGGISKTAGVVYTSTDGTRWSRIATTGPQGSDTHSLKWVAYGNGTWAVLADESVYNQPHGTWTELLTSHDGRSWTRAARLDAAQYDEIEFGAGKWLAVGFAADFAHVSLVSSPDLVQWTPVPGPSVALENAYAVGFGGSWLLAGGVASGDYASTVFSRAADGTWTPLATLKPLVGALASGG